MIKLFKKKTLAEKMQSIITDELDDELEALEKKDTHMAFHQEELNNLIQLSQKLKDMSVSE